MKLLRISSVLVVVLGLGALALAVAPAVFSPHASAQDRPMLAERPYDAPQAPRAERRAREMTMLAGRGAGLGVRIADADNGVVIEDVDPDSPAEKAGLKKSDVFLEFDGERVRSARQLARLVQETPSGKTVKAAVRRDGQRKDVDITPDDRRGDVMISGDFGGYMRDLGRDLGRLGDRLPNFNFDFGMPGTISGRRLGVTVQELTPQLGDYFGAKHGVLVTSVAESSSASRAGLKAGDVITSVNGKTVESRLDLQRELRDASSDEVTIGIVRDKKESSLKAKIEPPRRITRARPA
jgi:serine protease Do